MSINNQTSHLHHLNSLHYTSLNNHHHQNHHHHHHNTLTNGKTNSNNNSGYQFLIDNSSSSGTTTSNSHNNNLLTSYYYANSGQSSQQSNNLDAGTLLIDSKSMNKSVIDKNESGSENIKKNTSELKELTAAHGGNSNVNNTLSTFIYQSKDFGSMPSSFNSSTASSSNSSSPTISAQNNNILVTNTSNKTFASLNSSNGINDQALVDSTSNKTSCYTFLGGNNTVNTNFTNINSNQTNDKSEKLNDNDTQQQLGSLFNADDAKDTVVEYNQELAETIEYELGLKKQNGPRKNSWGNLSYAELITRAIESSPDKRLTLSQIYDWIIKYVPFFKEKYDRTSSAGWKNSIRHNLSLHNRFIRVQNESSGKSSWWMINPDMNKYSVNPALSGNGGLKSPSSMSEFENGQHQMSHHHHHILHPYHDASATHLSNITLGGKPLQLNNEHMIMKTSSAGDHHHLIDMQNQRIKTLGDTGLDRPMHVSKKCRRGEGPDFMEISGVDEKTGEMKSAAKTIGRPGKLKNKLTSGGSSNTCGKSKSFSGSKSSSKSIKMNKIDENNDNNLSSGNGNDNSMMQNSIINSNKHFMHQHNCGGLQSILVDSPISSSASSSASTSPPSFGQFFSQQNSLRNGYLPKHHQSMQHQHIKSPPTPPGSTPLNNNNNNNNNNSNGFVYQPTNGVGRGTVANSTVCYNSTVNDGSISTFTNGNGVLYAASAVYQPNISLDYNNLMNNNSVQPSYMNNGQQQCSQQQNTFVSAYQNPYMTTDDYYAGFNNSGHYSSAKNGNFSQSLKFPLIQNNDVTIKQQSAYCTTNNSGFYSTQASNQILDPYVSQPPQALSHSLYATTNVFMNGAGGGNSQSVSPPNSTSSLSSTSSYDLSRSTISNAPKQISLSKTTAASAGNGCSSTSSSSSSTSSSLPSTPSSLVSSSNNSGMSVVGGGSGVGDVNGGSNFEEITFHELILNSGSAAAAAVASSNSGGFVHSSPLDNVVSMSASLACAQNAQSSSLQSQQQQISCYYN